MYNRNISAVKIRRCLTFLAATIFLLPFTILMLVADQQFKLTYNSKRVFYQENDISTAESYTESNNRVNSLAKFLYNNSSKEELLLPKSRLIEINERMESRREHLKNECHKHGLDDSNHKSYTWEYLINKQYHVIWCNIFKAASTSWLYNFNLMANYSASFLQHSKDVPLELARKKYARPTVEMVRQAQKDSITFLIVRHPLERLASAYNDKILHAWPGSHHEKMGHRILRRFRPHDKNILTESSQRPTFKEFVAYLLEEVKSKRSLDMHWTPYTNFCTPCKVNIDIILKFETLEDDQKYLIQVAHLQDKIKPEWKNSGKSDTLKLLKQYYSTITRNQLEALYNLYQYDFQLFNYTLDSYYEYVEKA